MQTHHVRRSFFLSAAIAALLAIAAPPARAQQADATQVAIDIGTLAGGLIVGGHHQGSAGSDW